jgi:ABC-type lipoprotein release transport system permease subunit
MNLAVVASCAVAVAVLTGALVVGDSVRGSLRDLTLERLGSIDEALQAPGFFRVALASDLEEANNGVGAAVAAVLLPGSARNPATGSRASGLRVQGVGDDFRRVFPAAVPTLEALQASRSVVINEALQRELAVSVGEEILLAVEKPGDAPRETLLGSTETEDVVRQLRLRVGEVIADRGLGRFQLDPHQSLPLLAFVDLGVLQEALEQPERANTILVSREGDAPLPSLDESLAASLQLEDVGLELRVGERWLSVESRDHILSPEVEGQVERYASSRAAGRLRVSTYIANELRNGDRSAPYSAITALDVSSADAFGDLELIAGSRRPAAGEVLVNAWLAEDLDLEPGDPLEMSYFEVGAREELFERETELRVAGVVGMSGLAVDRGLTPDFPGIHEADDMADWDPPFPVDLSQVRDRDEEYWDRFGATPKVFFAEEHGVALWSTRFGRYTSIRLEAPPDIAVEDWAARVEDELAHSLDPAGLGLRFDAVRQRGLAASAGATDFRGLFLGFSMFLIASAAMLVGLFFALGVEQRATEIGLLFAMGFPLRHVRRLFLAEGAVLAAVGTVIGAVGAVAYAAAMIAALRSWWQAAVGTPFLYVHVEPASLLLGAAIGFVVVGASIWSRLRRLGGVPAVALLKGAATEARGGAARRSRSKPVFVVSAASAAVLLVVALAFGRQSSPALFFGVGACLLVAGLALFAGRLARPSARLGAKGGGRYLPMAVRNASLNPGRSLLSAALVASAAFVIVAVAANGFRYGEEVRELGSAAGGYSVVAESAIPLHQDLSSEEAVFEHGFGPGDAELLAATVVTPFRLLPGDDVSCLNLYQPERPRILGVPASQVERGGFHFQRLAFESDDPWSLLERDLGEGVVPAFGDNESMTWILKVGLGEDIVVENERGEPVRLRLVGLLEKSLFQGEVLISEQSFERHFPSRSGYSYFLLDPPVGREQELATALEDKLGDYGFDSTGTADRLQRFQAVFNTYLATFQALGGLGLLLGTVGLAAILLRNVLERRSELATLRALGFARRSLAWLVLTENGVLLVMGVAIGAVAALVAVAPHLVAGNALVPWSSLAGTLGLILVVGMLAAALAVRRALGAPLLPALKGD